MVAGGSASGGGDKVVPERYHLIELLIELLLLLSAKYLCPGQDDDVIDCIMANWPGTICGACVARVLNRIDHDD